MKIPVEWLKQYIHTKKSAKELAESFTALGLMLDKPIYNAENKMEVIDLEHRMDRADWLSILGCARDLAAFENINLIQPELYDKKGKTLPDDQKIKIEIKCPDLVRRFNTRVFKNIKVGKSPDWLKNRLEAYGIPSINNVVDITNYVMVELGQPMHAQDLAKLEKPEIVIRRAKNGEKITTLLGESINLDDQMFVLTQNDTPTVLGGIVGGIATGIDESTTDIILDAGNYDQINIRKTSRRIKIQNETVIRYDKFLHPKLTEISIARATKLILELAGGEYYENQDWYPKETPIKKLTLTYDRIKMISGFELDANYIENVLDKLEYKILNQNSVGFNVEVPYFRTDVEVEDDIVADMLRIYNYADIPLNEVNAAPPKDITPKIYLFEQKIRDVCVGLGLHEHITDPLVAAVQEDKLQVKLENSQSQFKNAMRTNIYDGLKSIAENYKKHQFKKIKLFEVGNVYSQNNSGKIFEDFIEKRVTQIYLRLLEKNYNENSIVLRAYLSALLRNLGIETFELVQNKNDKTDILIKGEICGYIDWDLICLFNGDLINYWKPAKRVVTEVGNKHFDDLSLLVPAKVKVGSVVTKLIDEFKDITEIEAVPQTFEGESKEYKAILFKFEHKLNDFADVRSKIVKILSEAFKIKIR